MFKSFLSKTCETKSEGVNLFTLFSDLLQHFGNTKEIAQSSKRTTSHRCLSFFCAFSQFSKMLITS